MESMHDALQKRLAQSNLNRSLSAAVIVESANRVLPPELRAKIFKEGMLTIEAATSHDAFFLKQEQETYLERINAALAQNLVTKIRIRTNYR
jgi:predicted nucleic acid-binding Zn ribbon protein